MSINYQWKSDASGHLSMSEGSVDPTNWPASAVPEFIEAKNRTGQQVVVDAITDDYPALKRWLADGGGYEIGISIVDEDNLELSDTGGLYLLADEKLTIDVATSRAADGADVKLAIQFFKMKSGSNHASGSVAMTEEEARELERIFTLSS